MHPLSVRATARDLHRSGLTIAEVSRRLGLCYHTVSVWCRRSMPTDAVPDRSRDRCPRCQEPPGPPGDPAAYAYLLGLYLGDGYLALGARVPVLRIACADAYPQIMDECERAMRAVLARSVSRVHAIGCTAVQSVAKHWPCLLPQAGRGRKHERPITLALWQRDVVIGHPGYFVRGLFHSDGCRSINRVTVRGKTYEYPRYLLANESADILGLAGWALDLLGVAWRLNRRNSLSVARRDAVALLDQHVGPKS
ncbi:transcriptional regulator [Catellatospora sp. IY07-71]|uniref:transcriptional regulator n=1 Tax=Catellatospora sp. IY07-71 TaxID=2728827 RepID=UPI001BB32A67|nr:transcriptional regulator [Catellatospora sp. IY07-71]